MTLTPSQIMGILRLSYHIEPSSLQLIKNYKQAFLESNHQKALPLRPHRRVFEWFVSRSFEFEKAALSPDPGRKGIWRVVENKGRTMMIFRYPFGVVHWYKNGKVLVYLQGEFSWAKVKEVFSRAFLGVLGKKELVEQLDAPVKEVGKHWVFQVGQTLPRFEIRQFEKGHGLRIYTDGSHPTAVEVAETEPFWLNRMDDIANSFQESMNEHLKIIEIFRKESESRSKQLLKLLSKKTRKRARKKRVGVPSVSTGIKKQRSWWRRLFLAWKSWALLSHLG